MTHSAAHRRAYTRSAKAVAALGAAASIALAVPGGANAAIAIPEVPEWVSQILPSPEQVADGSKQYEKLITWLGGEEVQNALGGWNSIAGAVPGGLLPTVSSETKYTNGRDKGPAGAPPGSMHFKTLFERADMKGFYDLLGAQNVGMLNLAEIFGKSRGMILDRYENVTVVDGLLFGGTTKLTNSYAWMPGFTILGNEVPEFAIWIPEAQGDYTSIGGSGFGFHNSLPTMALPGLGAIPLPHSAGYLTAPLGLGGADYYVETLLPTFGEDGALGLRFPAFGGSLATPLGALGFAMDMGPTLSVLDGGAGFDFGSPTFAYTDPLGTRHEVGFVLGGISYTQADGLKVTGPDLTVTSTPAPEPEVSTAEAPVSAAATGVTSKTVTTGTVETDETDDTDDTDDSTGVHGVDTEPAAEPESEPTTAPSVEAKPEVKTAPSTEVTAEAGTADTVEDVTVTAGTGTDSGQTAAGDDASTASSSDSAAA